MSQAFAVAAPAVRWLLRRLPSRLLTQLDAWSHREALRRAERRRQSAMVRR